MAVRRGTAAAILGFGALAGAAAAFFVGRSSQSDRNNAARAAEEAQHALEAAMAASLQKLSEEVETAVALPQLRAAIANKMDTRTLEDLFATEDWWEPYRLHALTLMGPAGPLVSRNAPAAGLGAAELAARAAAGRVPPIVVRAGDQVVLAAAAAVNIPHPPGRVLVLGRLLDQSLLADWSTRARATLLVSDGRAPLVAAADAAARYAELGGRESETVVLGGDGAWAAAPLALGPAIWIWSVRTLPVSGMKALALPLWAGSGLLGVVALVLALLRRRGKTHAVADSKLTSPSPAATPSSLVSSVSSAGSGPVVAPLKRIGANLSTMIAGAGEGQMFGRYTVLNKLGEGGMCDIYTAALTGPEGFQRVFVLKRLKPELVLNRAAVNQFIDEAKLGSMLVHSNIVPIFDFGRVGDGYFIAQEYIVGRNVAQLCERHLQRVGEPLDLATVFYLAHEILAALGYAHDKTDDAGEPLRIVHRDVSSGNIVVSRLGEVKLIDFGIVKAEGRVSQTDIGNVKGNAAFMAPEQARGLPVDRRADLFSLAVVMFRALSGEHFYPGGTTAEVFYGAASGPTAEHFDRLDRLNALAARVLKKALMPNAADRYATAEEFAADIVSYVPASAKANLATLLHALFGDELSPSSGGTGGGGGTGVTSGIRRGAV